MESPIIRYKRAEITATVDSIKAIRITSELQVMGCANASLGSGSVFLLGLTTLS